MKKDIEYFLDDKGSGSVEVYKIIEKGKSLKVKLSLTDKHYCVEISN